MGNVLKALDDLGIANDTVAKFLATFKEFPPSQRPQSFSIDQIVEKMQKSFEAMGQ